jgi:hypothetical protein
MIQWEGPKLEAVLSELQRERERVTIAVEASAAEAVSDALLSEAEHIKDNATIDQAMSGSA